MPRISTISISVFLLLGFALGQAVGASHISTRQYSLQGELTFSFFKGSVETRSEKSKCEVLRDGEFLRITTYGYRSNFPVYVFVCDLTNAFTCVQYRPEDGSAVPSEPGVARAWNNASVYVSSYRMPSYMIGRLTPLWLMTQGAAERDRIGTNGNWITVFGKWPSTEFHDQPQTVPNTAVEAFWPDGFARFAEAFEFSDPENPGATFVQEETFNVLGWTNCADVRFPAGFVASVTKKVRRAIGEPKPILEARFTFVTSKVGSGPAAGLDARGPRLSDVGDMRPFERGELPNGLSYHSTNGIIYSDPMAESKEHGLRVIPLIVRKAKPGLQVGSVAPDFSIRTLDGKDLKLADFRGKYLVLDFWATWCGPCIGEIPDLKATYEELARDDRFVMVGLSFDSDREKLVAFVREKDIHWPQAMLPEGFASQMAKSYGIDAIPSIFLIGPDGKFISCFLGGHGIKQAVTSALSPTKGN